MGKLLKLTEKLTNTPHLMLPSALDNVFGYLSDRNNVAQLAVELEKEVTEREVMYVPETKVGVVPVYGPLTYIEYEAVCGERSYSYQQVRRDFDYLVSAGAKTIILDIDSPGGEAFSMMETGRYLRKKSDEMGIKLLTYVDGCAASAGYGLACSAHEVIANPESELGSVGVVVRLRNTNKAMKEMGVEDTYIYAGKSKIPFTEDGEWREEFISDIQDKVSMLYENFTAYVADMQGITQEAVKNTEARMFMAKDAVELGMADKIMSREDFYNYIADIAEGKDMPLLFTKKKEDKPKMEEEVSKEAFAALQTEVTELTSKLTEALINLKNSGDAKVEMETQFAQLKDELTAAKAAASQLEKEKAEAKDKSRLASLEAVTNKDEAAELFKSLKGLDDVGFEMVVNSFKVKNEAVEKGFKEFGGNQKQEALAENVFDKRIKELNK